MRPSKTRDLEVELSVEGSKAIIEGKTSVPFKTFVQLILQRKVTHLFKTHADEPVIMSSEMLTDLASAPDDSLENRAQLVMVTFGVGILCGIFAFAVLMFALLSFNIQLQRFDYAIIIGLLLGLAALVSLMSRTKKRNRGEKITETMEQITSVISK